MRKPLSRCVSAMSLAATVDEFLEWMSKHRSRANYINYRYRLQRFMDR